MTSNLQLKEKDIQTVFAQFEKRRRTRLKKGPIPGYLWEAALSLSSRYSVHEISKTLHMNHHDLRIRIEAWKRDQKYTQPQGLQLIEIPIEAGRETGLEKGDGRYPCVIELQKPYGAMMRVLLGEDNQATLYQLTKLFLGGES